MSDVSRERSVEVLDPVALRPMPFGGGRLDTISDPLVEPVWGGLRVLVHVADGRTVIRDREGLEVEVQQTLLESIASCSLASELVLDGHLVQGPLRDTTGIRVSPDVDAVRTARESTRHFFLGRLGTPRRDLVAEKEAAVALASAATSTMAFVAVDLLWLDGESLLDVPLLERKRLLESVLSDAELVRRTIAVRPPIETWHAQWLSLGFREMAIKGANSRYTPGEPNPEWAIALIRRR